MSISDLNNMRISVQSGITSAAQADTVTQEALQKIERSLLEQYLWALLNCVDKYVNEHKDQIEPLPECESGRSTPAADTAAEGDVHKPSPPTSFGGGFGSMSLDLTRSVQMTTTLKKGEDFINDYVIMYEIGRGSYAKVVLGVNQYFPDTQVAIKIVHHSILRDQNVSKGGGQAEVKSPATERDEESALVATPMKERWEGEEKAGKRRNSDDATALLVEQMQWEAAIVQQHSAQSVSDTIGSSENAGPPLKPQAELATSAMLSSGAPTPFACGPKSLRRMNSIVQIQREIQIMKKLRHKNIVTLHSVIDDPESNELFIVMDYIPHGPILTIKKTDPPSCQPLPEFKVKRYLGQLIDGLRYLHKHNVVHRDIKPANILLGENDRIYLSDFGVAEFARDSMLSVTSSQGTLLYWPPEMFSPCVHEWSGEQQDLWALGVTVFLMLAGEFPFFGENYFEIAHSVCNDELIVPEYVSETARNLLASMLNKDAAQRLSLLQLRMHPFLADLSLSLRTPESNLVSPNTTAIELEDAKPAIERRRSLSPRGVERRRSDESKGGMAVTPCELVKERSGTHRTRETTVHLLLNDEEPTFSPSACDLRKGSSDQSDPSTRPVHSPDLLPHEDDNGSLLTQAPDSVWRQEEDLKQKLRPIDEQGPPSLCATGTPGQISKPSRRVLHRLSGSGNTSAPSPTSTDEGRRCSNCSDTAILPPKRAHTEKDLNMSRTTDSQDVAEQLGAIQPSSLRPSLSSPNACTPDITDLSKNSSIFQGSYVLKRRRRAAQRPAPLSRVAMAGRETVPQRGM